ncbi:RelA/SpoT domain-containing protein [Terasakiella pusilla]|uniref:RelA/SpoT domain-containing protein n=1 Tax=Terasakiella pusilla TaxID=64973 RepID=UPI003AA7AD55
MSRDVFPEYSKTRVDRAGAAVRRGTDTPEDLEIIENWRASHNHILNSWQATLRGRIKDKDIIFAQRLKRKNTVFDKLARQGGMNLSRMHDLAGCRLIFKDIKDLYEYRTSLHTAHMYHERHKEDETPYPYDYISTPKDTGYRGIHDVYRYKARKKRPDSWNGLQVEIQYRTTNQHAWATAVEVSGLITGNHAKFERGEEDNKEFFRLSSEIIARVWEQSNSCYPTLSNKELIDRFDQVEQRTRLLRRLNGVQVLAKEQDYLNNLGRRNNLILSVGENNGKLRVSVSRYQSFPLASAKYFEFEEKYPDRDIVLVRSDSLDQVKKAFQNYFGDTKNFVRLIKSGLKKL